MGKHLGVKRTKSLKAVQEMGLPTPRLQFRWEPLGAHTGDQINGDDWYCHYELVIRLGKYDIRNPHEYKREGELTLQLGGTRRNATNPPDFYGTVDTPFRDGAHADWDSEQLGIKHIYAIYDGKVTDVIAERDKRKKAA